MKDQYDLFRQAEDLMRMQEERVKVRADTEGLEGGKYLMAPMYQKLVQTGGLADVHHDYGRGFLVVQVRTLSQARMEGRFCTRLWFATIDDGDYGAWGREIPDFYQALENARQVADIFRPMVSLPDPDCLNEMLRPYGLWVGRE